MAEPSTHINYSFEDIQRYLQGKMSAAEMHALEKAALQDAFLADAIEGYTDVDATTAQRHLNEINAGLFNERKKLKVIAFNNRKQWISIAALIIIIAGAGIISFFVLNKSNSKNEIAQLKKQSVNDSARSKISDTGMQQNLSSMQNDVAQNKPEAKQATASAARKRSKKYNTEKDKSVQTDEDNVTAMVAPVQQQTEAAKSYAPAAVTEKNDAEQKVLQGKASGIATTENTFSGKILDQNGEPVPFAVIQLNKKQSSTTADAEGKFNVQVNDSSLAVTASAVGYNEKTDFIKSSIQNTIILNKANSRLNEAVITTAISSKKKSKLSSNTAMPVSGWQNFNIYVAKSLNKDSADNNYANAENFVEIEFLIDKNGNPYNFKIIKSLDDEKDSKAIDILKAGPKWITSSKNKKARVKIAF